MSPAYPVPALLLVAGLLAQGPIPFGPESHDARPVSFLSATAAVVNWHTEQPCETLVQLRTGAFPAGTPGHADVWKEPRLVTGLRERTTAHSMMLTGLEPATEYYYRVFMPGSDPGTRDRVWAADPPWSREFAFTTRAGRGQKVVLRIPVKVLIVPNVIDFGTITQESTVPARMPSGELETYRREFRQSALFYWINSGMRYWIDLDFFVEPEWQRVGKPQEGMDEFYKGWPAVRGGLRVFDSADLGNHRAAWPLKESKIYAGQVVMRCTRRWNGQRKEWIYQGSGGGTFGVDWMGWGDKTQRPAPGRSGFLGGSDIAWLMTHEFKHQLESQYQRSGLQREDDRAVFCHFAPKFIPPTGKGWAMDTAFDHGPHYDGIAWELRALTQVQYLRNMFGHAHVTADADGDGVPDDDPRLPLDEKRFGSDGHATSTDGSGVTDLQKAMFAKWVPAVNTRTRDKRFHSAYQAMWRMATGGKPDGRPARPGYVCPSAIRRDSDGDGVEDARDPYPVYPWLPVLGQGTVQLDGDLGDWKEHPVIGALEDLVTVVARACYDRGFLYYAIEWSGPVTSVELLVDGDADGWYVGNDNVRLVFGPRARTDDPGSPFVLRSTGIHLASDRSWPHWDTGQPFRGPARKGGEPWQFQRPKVFGDKRDIAHVSRLQGQKTTLEIAIPNGTGRMPIQVGPGHTIAMSLNVGIEGRGTLSVYEPQTLFRATAR